MAREKNRSQGTNDRRKEKHYPPASGRIRYPVGRGYPGRPERSAGRYHQRNDGSRDGW